MILASGCSTSAQPLWNGMRRMKMGAAVAIGGGAAGVAHAQRFFAVGLVDGLGAVAIATRDHIAAITHAGQIVGQCAAATGAARSA